MAEALGPACPFAGRPGAHGHLARALGARAGRALCPAGRWPPSCAALRRGSSERWSGGPATPLPFPSAVCSSQLNQSEAKMPWWWRWGWCLQIWLFWGWGCSVFVQLCSAGSSRSFANKSPGAERRSPPPWPPRLPPSPPPRLGCLPARGRGLPRKAAEQTQAKQSRRCLGPRGRAGQPALPGLWVWVERQPARLDRGHAKVQVAGGPSGGQGRFALSSDPRVCFLPTPRGGILEFSVFFVQTAGPHWP